MHRIIDIVWTKHPGMAILAGALGFTLVINIPALWRLL